MKKIISISAVAAIAIYLVAAGGQMARADSLQFSASEPHTSEPVNVTQGQSATVSEVVYSNNNQPVTVWVDMEIKDVNNQKVGQAFFDNQNFGIQASQEYSMQTSSSLPLEHNKISSL